MQKPLRLWPGVAAVILQWLAWIVLPLVADVGPWGMLAGAALGLVVALWWLLFSRAPWSERLGAFVVIVAAVAATKRVVHPSIENGGMGNFVYIYSIPLVSLGLVSWAVATRHVSAGLRRVSMVPSIVLASLLLTLARTGGITGDAKPDLHWRWTKSPEERLIAQHDTVPAVLPAAPVAQAAPSNEAPAPAAVTIPEKPAIPAIVPEPAAIWPGFRGPHRDGVVPGVQIETDWSKSPPAELWRRKVGPGWSSFAVRGHAVYTQEQRGDDEVVASYELTTGKPLWRHRDAARFWESNGGAGPRATPTISNGRIYTLGGTGILNALDANTGAVLWSRNAATDTGVETPGWGFAGSPLVIDDEVVVATSGRLASYDIASGKQRWLGPTGGGGYSSPHLVSIDGVPQIVLLRGARTTSVSPSDGTLLWEHRGEPSVSIVQPAVADRDILVAAGDSMGGLGIRRIAVSHGPNGWSVEERWTSRGLKPYFNDFVVHKGHAYGFDGNILSCIDLNDGARTWKGGRYGNGQLVLLPDQDLLLVLSEDGEIVLVKATPDQFTELARAPALEGKTWNHPVVAGDVLLVRNGEEMVAFRLTRRAPPTE